MYIIVQVITFHQAKCPLLFHCYYFRSVLGFPEADGVFRFHAPGEMLQAGARAGPGKPLLSVWQTFPMGGVAEGLEMCFRAVGGVQGQVPVVLFTSHMTLGKLLQLSVPVTSPIKCDPSPFSSSAFAERIQL